MPNLCCLAVCPISLHSALAYPIIVCRTVTAPLLRSVERLEEELAGWEQAHQAMVSELGSTDGEGRAGEGQEGDHGEDGTTSAYDAMEMLLAEVVGGEAAEVLAEVEKERAYANSTMRRILLGAVTAAVSKDAGVQIPTEIPAEVTDALRDLQHLRNQIPEKALQHHLRVSTKWKGAPPRLVKCSRAGERIFCRTHLLQICACCTGSTHWPLCAANT